MTECLRIGRRTPKSPKRYLTGVTVIDFEVGFLLAPLAFELSLLPKSDRTGLELGKLLLHMDLRFPVVREWLRRELCTGSIDFRNALIEPLLKQLKTHYTCILQPFCLQDCRSLLAAMQ